METIRNIGEKVIPHFQGHLATPTASHDWAVAKRNELFGRAGQAIMNAIVEHVEDTSPATAGAE
jgi:limonene 1,2-monooxygenase